MPAATISRILTSDSFTSFSRKLILVLSALAVTALTVLGVGTGNQAASAATTSRSLLPTGGVALGAFVDKDGYWTGEADAKNEIASREADMGRKFAINNHFYNWDNSFPTGLEWDDKAKGRTPMITWEPHGITLDQINNGSQDSKIRTRATAIKNFGAPVYLRFAHEMNGNWYDWDGTHNNTPGTTDGPAKYVAAYQRVHDLFAAAGATNVSWVWCVNSEDAPNTSWNHWTNYYPGDAYTDWVAIDTYNWGTTKTWSTWQELATVMDPVYRDYAARKPIMLAEWGSVEQGGNKPNWFNNASGQLPTAYPKVRAVVYFDKPDWSLKSSTYTWSAFRTLANSPNFAGKISTTAP